MRILFSSKVGWLAVASRFDFVFFGDEASLAASGLPEVFLLFDTALVDMTMVAAGILHLVRTRRSRLKGMILVFGDKTTCRLARLDDQSITRCNPREQ